MLGFTFLKNETAHSFLPDLSIFTYHWTCTQIFFTLLTSVLLISFPVSHMMLITSAVLYLPFKPWFLIWFLFYQAHVNFLLSSSVSPPLLFSSKVLRTKSYTFTLQHYEIYRTFFFFFSFRPSRLYLSLNNNTANWVWDYTSEWLMFSKSWVSFPRLFTQSPSWVKGFSWYLPWLLEKQG